MYDYLIKEYVKSATITDIINFGQSKGINISEHDAKILLDYLKRDWETFYRGNPSDKIKELEGKIEPLTFNKLKTIYIEIKDKITH